MDENNATFGSRRDWRSHAEAAGWAPPPGREANARGMHPPQGTDKMVFVTDVRIADRTAAVIAAQSEINSSPLAIWASLIVVGAGMLVFIVTGLVMLLNGVLALLEGGDPMGVYGGPPFIIAGVFGVILVARFRKAYKRHGL